MDKLLDRIEATDANTVSCRISVENDASGGQWGAKTPIEEEAVWPQCRRWPLQVTKPVGRDAAAKKYDILSALLVYGLQQDKHRQRLIMRLMALITARYNWQRDELTLAQTEMAKLWSVDTRTVKREVAKLRGLGWLVEKRAAARGRVAVHGIALDQIMADTKPAWGAIGADFVARVQPRAPEAPVEGNVVPLRAAAVPKRDGSLWRDAQAVFHDQDAAAYAAWVERLEVVAHEGGELTLIAPSRFHARYVVTHLTERLMVILRRIDPSLNRLIVQH